MKKIFKITSIIAVMFILSCKKNSKDGFLSEGIKYNVSLQTANVGGLLYRSGAMITDESTKPLEFSIASVKKEDGSSADFLLNTTIDTYFWNGEYTSKEKTTVEVDAKRKKVTRPVLDINPVNGEIFIYPELLDPTKFPAGVYLIDIRVKNSSGEKVFSKALRLSVKFAGTGDYFYQFSGVDGKVDAIAVEFKQIDATGNKLIVHILKPDGSPVNPARLSGYDYATAGNDPDLKDWHNLGPGNPTKYTVFPDRLELDVNFPLPYIAGKRITIDQYNNGDINGAYFNYWFNFAIYKPGTWDITIKMTY
ncbi:hypothetical protein DBR43_20100 [Pedobacter sp. KBW06]|uniref:DUF5007 domain-containing protein n=1 Tax=Pedobacter sp. KBW06 TaxID=2153359 RepID=UPI000F5B14D3|nr:DUF5007 domain-containing protein [Pedobacter sp. KBW06]RQO70326.1 hypothetical protein DBR43_20100 [Pedobacter sp. KBW06]